MDPYKTQGLQQGQDSRFHYPQYKNQTSTTNYAQPSQYQQFPPHPSVRVPPNVKLSARNQVPPGVGVALPPTRYEAGLGTAPPPVRYETSQRQPQQRSPAPGMLIQDFKFPAAPPIPPSGPGRMRHESSQSPGSKYNMHESYMSSLVDGSSTTHSSKSRGFPTSRRYSGSVYAESEALGLEEPFGEGAPSPEISRPGSSDGTPQIVRQASLGKRAKPAMTTIKNPNNQLEQSIPENGFVPSQTSRSATMSALSAALAAGMSSQPIDARSGTPGSRSFTPVRMPFDTSPPASPSADREFLQTPKTPTTTVSSKFPTKAAGSVHSQKSTNPLLGLGIEQPSMSDKIPPSRRPPMLDMDAVREAENRGSTTSLADLIRRATKLAANLDRGKTASRLGMLDMFGSTEKLGTNNRHSTMSDMISAFPAPAYGATPTNKRDTAWPLGEKDAYASTTDLSKGPNRRRRRKCCGLSLPIFILAFIVVIVLVAAAVLIPIFLILVPRQHHKSTSSSDCATSNPCRNGGFGIVSDNACVCVCSNGFTGSYCETSESTGNCITVTLNDGSTEYRNATMGRSIAPTFSDAQTRFGIPLNVSTILSLFSSNNLSCTVENSLLDFNSSVLSQGRIRKRFIMLPGFEPNQDGEPQPPVIHGGPSPPQITKRAEADCDDMRLERRQTGVSTGTVNGIVFQASSATAGPEETSPPIGTDVSTVSSVSSTTTAEDPSATAGSDESPSATTTSSNGATSSSTVNDVELEFAKVVVLFVLQESRTVSVAVNAQQQMESFFSAQIKGNSSTSVDVGSGDLNLTANFDKLSITKGDGQVIGGQE